MDRREFLKGAVAGGGLALLGSLASTQSAAATAAAAEGPYGPLGAPDANGIWLPAGFSSRVIAVTDAEVGSTGYIWHRDPDGGATFAQPDRGWVYVSNSESDSGGASMVRFDSSGGIVAAGSILSGTSRNCAGGATPWGSWLSCEEFSGGQVWECDPLGSEPAAVRPAMGVFKHEAAAADPVREVIYLTEDRGDGALYRFVPGVWGDLSSGRLEVLVETAGDLGWAVVPDPSASQVDTRDQVEATKRFDGGEGAWFDGTHLYFTTKGDNRVWRYDPGANSLAPIYDIATAPDPVLSGVDNVTVSPTGDVFVCEDGGNMEVVMIMPDGSVSPFLRVGTSGSELTGVAFDPSGTRMYFSSQRNPGVTYEVSGPFRMAPDSPSGAATASMDIASIVVVGRAIGHGVSAEATVVVLDRSGAPVGSTAVAGEWRMNGAPLSSVTGRIAGDGSAMTVRTKTPMGPGDLLSFTVTELSAPDMTWDPQRGGPVSASWEYVPSSGGRARIGRDGANIAKPPIQRASG